MSDGLTYINKKATASLRETKERPERDGAMATA